MMGDTLWIFSEGAAVFGQSKDLDRQMRYPVMEINGGCRRGETNDTTDKKWGKSHANIPDSMCQLMNGSGDSTGFGWAPVLHSPICLGS